MESSEHVDNALLSPYSEVNIKWQRELLLDDKFLNKFLPNSSLKRKFRGIIN